MAVVWDRRGLTAGAALLVGWGLWAGLAGAAEPQLVHRDRDGTAPLFRVLAGAREWTGLLPRYVLEEPDRHRLGLVWALALLAAVPWRARRLTASRAALAALGLLATAQVASTVGRREGAERDAVRLVGRPALAVPGWFVQSCLYRRVVARRARLGGRSTSPIGTRRGLALGERLPLPSGRYILTLESEPLVAGAWPRAGVGRGPARGRVVARAVRADERRPGRGVHGAGGRRLASGCGAAARSWCAAIRLSAQPSGPGPV